MGEANDTVDPQDSEAANKFRRAVNKSRYALRLVKAIEGNAVIVPDKRKVEKKISNVTRLLDEFKATGNADVFDDKAFNLTDQELASFDAPPERKKLFKRMRHPIVAKQESKERDEFNSTIEDLRKFIRREKRRIYRELKGKRFKGDTKPTGDDRKGLLYQAKSANLALELLDQGNYRGAQRVLQSLMYLDTMGKLGRMTKPPANQIDDDDDDDNAKDVDEYLRKAIKNRGKPDLGPLHDRGNGLKSIGKAQVVEAANMKSAASLMKSGSKKKLEAMIANVASRFDEYKAEMNSAAAAALPDQIDDERGNEIIAQHDARLDKAEKALEESETELAKARAFYADNSEITENLKNVLFSDLIEGKDGEVQMQGAALTGTGTIKTKDKRDKKRLGLTKKENPIPQGPLKEIVAQYHLVKALEDNAMVDKDSQDMKDRIQRELNRKVSFLEKNKALYKDIQGQFNTYKKDLVRKRWAYDAAAKADLEKKLDEFQTALDNARTTEDLTKKVQEPLGAQLTLMKNKIVPLAGKRRDAAEYLQRRLDNFSDLYFPKLSKAMSAYAQAFDIKVRSAEDVVKGVSDVMENRADKKKSDKKKLKSAGKEVAKETAYKGKYEIEFQSIRNSVRFSDHASVEAQDKALLALGNRISKKAAEIKAAAAAGPPDDAKGKAATDKSKNLTEEITNDLMYSEYEAGRIAAVKPLLKSRVSSVKKTIRFNKAYAPMGEKATYDTLKVRLKSIEARMDSAQSSEEFNTLWEELRGLEAERQAAGGSAAIKQEADVGKIVERVVEAEKMFAKTMENFFTDRIAPVGNDAAKKANAEKVDPSFQTFAGYCDAKSQDNKKGVINKFTKRLPDVLSSKSLDGIYTKHKKAFEEGASDTLRREAKEALLADLRWRREAVYTSAHGQKLRLNPFDNGDGVNSYLRILQAAEGQIMAKVK